MFDMGFWEIALIFVIMLLVVGPERLPEVARTLGIWIGRARRMVSSVRSEVEREFKVDDIRRSIREHAYDEEFKRLADQVKSINRDVEDTRSQAKTALDDAAKGEENEVNLPPRVAATGPGVAENRETGVEAPALPEGKSSDAKTADTASSSS
ncbi:MAG: Sec-independent protein translocase protein TatB [Candidatus Competibacterales bacterium]